MKPHTRDNFHPISVLADVQSGYLRDAPKAELLRVIAEACHAVQRLKDKAEKDQRFIDALYELMKENRCP